MDGEKNDAKGSFPFASFLLFSLRLFLSFGL